MEHINKNAIIKEIVVILFELINNQIKVIFNWIPSHVDIKENDKVGSLAKDACKNELIQIQVPINRSEINKEIQLKYQLIWERQYKLQLNNKGQFFKLIKPDVKNIQINTEKVKHYLFDCLKYQHYQENLVDFANKNKRRFFKKNMVAVSFFSKP